MVVGQIWEPRVSTPALCIAGRKPPDLGGGEHFCHSLGFPDKVAGLEIDKDCAAGVCVCVGGQQTFEI